MAVVDMVESVIKGQLARGRFEGTIGGRAMIIKEEK